METTLFLVSGRTDFGVIRRSRLSVSQAGMLRREQQVNSEGASFQRTYWGHSCILATTAHAGMAQAWLRQVGGVRH